jgi:hypothetical protein
MTLDHMSETGKHVVDALSVGALVATFFEWLPGITAVLVAIWTIMRMYESWQAIQINRRKLDD